MICHVWLIELKVNWNDNSRGILMPVPFSFSQFGAEIIVAERWALYQIEANENSYLV
jgi:hypothetical protein